ncbi:hypothetical protein [Melittangium boletus]|uniref:Uncharacterized protein n=1 Tax=Melittangium boletus DSM 14713 TaxID=1294270 RepID=A0A250IGK9_9BACT|nr:hypothetical protein [Melittangium boletus]ATB30291.1 hypothetical protein MEBOL_003751 [Melittangium boletus DSM 14713]
MTVEAPPSATVPRALCPRCGTEVPLLIAGTQVIRCAGCGAALQVSVRPVDPTGTPPSAPPPVAEEAPRPRRRPMVEVSGPRRAEGARPVHTFTVELSQSDIDTEGIESKAAPARLPPPPPAPLAPTSIDTPWYAEDIERLPEANASLGQLALESFEALPPLPLRPDVPASSKETPPAPRTPGNSSRDK